MFGTLTVLILSSSFGQVTSATDCIKGTGIAEIRIKPMQVNMRFRVNVQDRLASDVLVKQKGAVKRAVDAFKKLKVDNMTVEEESVRWAMNANEEERIMMRGGSGKPEAPMLGLRTQILLKVEKLDTLDQAKILQLVGTILDCAKDCGAVLEGSERSRFYSSSDDGESIYFSATVSEAERSANLKKAMDSARVAAKEVADLSNVELGTVRFAEVASGDARGTSSSRMSALEMAMGGIRGNANRQIELRSSTLTPTLMTTIRVDAGFSIKPKTGNEK